MRRLTLLAIFFLSVSSVLVAQKNTIATIDGKPISKEEYEVIYKKNNTNLNDENEVKSPQDYMKMFVDFKLKVAEAENRGMDTTQAFTKELKGYRDELAKTYLTDIAITDSMVKVAYYRTRNLIKLSHILIELAQDASPEDTLKAYNKLMDIRNKYLNKEKTFAELAQEYSDEPSAKTTGGSLPYFGAFRMLTSFENAAYSTPIGEVSMPIRSQVGYHLLKVDKIVPSLGEMKVGHIMLKFSNNNEVPESEDKSFHAKIDSIYNLLINGANWAETAKKYSDDKLANQNDGIMKSINQEFGVPEFVDAAFALTYDGEISKPIRTKFGYHIIKRIETKPPKEFKEIESELTQKVKGDPLRAKYSKMKFIADRKKEYGYTFYNDNFKKFSDIVKSFNSDTIYKLPEDCSKIVLFNFAGKDNTAEQYFENIKSQYKLNYILRFKFLPGFNDYVDQFITDYENSRLEAKYPEFNYLINEYHDGILLFSIMEKEVWNKAIEDSVGLVNYYNQNKDKYEFGEYFDGMLIKCNSDSTRHIIEKAIADGTTNPDSLQAMAIRIGGNKNSVTKGRWEKGANRYVDFLVWKGEKPRDLKEDLQFVVGDIKHGGFKTLDDAKGLYISEYQALIEKEWLNQLHQKYKVTINEPLLRKIKSLKK